MNRFGVLEQRIVEHDGYEVVLKPDKLLANPYHVRFFAVFLPHACRLQSPFGSAYFVSVCFVSSWFAKAAARTAGHIILCHEQRGSTKATTRS